MQDAPERLALPPGGLRVAVKTHHKLCKEFAALNVVQVGLGFTNGTLNPKDAPQAVGSRAQGSTVKCAMVWGLELSALGHLAPWLAPPASPTARLPVPAADTRGWTRFNIIPMVYVPRV